MVAENLFLCSSYISCAQGKETNSGGNFCHPRGMLHSGCDFPFTRSVSQTYIYFFRTDGYLYFKDGAQRESLK